MEWWGSGEPTPCLKAFRDTGGEGNLAMENLTVGPFQLKAEQLVSSGFSKIQDPETSVNTHTKVLGTGNKAWNKKQLLGSLCLLPYIPYIKV